MNDFFATLYELNGIFHDIYSPLLWENGFYTKFGLIMLIIPVFVLAIFYGFITYPKCKWWHWFLFFLAGFGTVGIMSYNMLTDELATQVYNGEEGVQDFILWLTILNVGCAALLGFLFSFLPQFIVPNKSQSHLPILIKRR